MGTNKQNSIYTLFSVDNNYDQPANNLEAWWHDKPKLEELAEALGFKFPANLDEDTLKIVRIWSMEGESRIGNTDYRLECIKPGRI